jgi:WD40 repeat protein
VPSSNAQPSKQLSSTVTTPTPTQISKRDSVQTSPESIAEREAARDRIRQKYAEHLNRRQVKKSSPSTTPSLAANSSPRATSAAKTPPLPRTNREDSYAPTSNPVDSPNTLDPAVRELDNAVKNINDAFLILRGHVAQVRSVAYSPDGKYIASGSDDKTVKIWDATTGTILRSLRGHSHSVTSVFFSPDGKFVMSSGKDRTVRVWDATTGDPVQRSAGVSCDGSPAAFSPDGKFLATANSRNITISKVSK